MAADDIQINVQDLLSAYGTEHITILQRAILAEQRARALQRALDEVRRENAARATGPSEYERGLADGWDAHENGLSRDEAIGDVVRAADSAVEAVSRPPA